MPNPNVPIITPPRVPLVDPRTGMIDRAWYLFFVSLNRVATAVVDDPALGTNTESLIASYDAALQALAQNVDTQPLPTDLSAELTKQIEAAGLVDCCNSLISQMAEMQKQIEALNLLPQLPPAALTTGTSILYGDNLGGFSNVTIGSGVSFTSGTLSATGSGGTVTSVTGTAPVVSSGGTTPAISMAAATTSVNGYLTSTDWNTFNGKQAALVSGTNIKTINGSSVLGSGNLSITTSPGGSNTQIQYNNAGTFAGAANLQYDGTNLGIGITPDGSSFLQVAAGSATKAPFELTTSAGTLMTVPDDGSIEYDGISFYATPNANNRGVTVNEHFVARTGTKTMTSNTNLQSIFGGGSGALTNGALTVNGSTSYYFECSLNLSSMSASSGNLGFSIVGAGTATFTSAAWHAFGLDATTQTTGAAIGGSFSAAAGATGNITTAATGTAFSAVIKGIFRINAAGTIIPSVQLTTASAAVIGANCWFKCYAVGTDTVVSVGNWS